MATAFYREHPSFLRHRLRYGTFVSFANQYLYVETPKNACTKSKVLLWDLEGLLSRPEWPGSVHERRRYDGRLSLLDLGYYGARHVMEDSAFFKFCFFRDPVDRLVSGYRDKIRRVPHDDDAKMVATILEQFGLEKREDISFSQFADFVCSQDDLRRNNHFISQWALNMGDRIKYDFVGRIENYTDDMAYVLRRLGASKALVGTVAIKIHPSAGPEVEVDPATAKLITETYADDYRLLDYRL